jgi:hypothetical protein
VRVGGGGERGIQDRSRAPVGGGGWGVKCRPPQPAAHRTAGFGPAERMEPAVGLVLALFSPAEQAVDWLSFNK